MAYIAGTAPSAKPQRQPLSLCATTKVPMTAAMIHPTAQNASKSTTMRPRTFRGENSLTSVEATGSSAPSPRPTRKRNTISDATDHASAEAPVASP